MIINYLKEAKTLQELKKLYFQLAKKLHPDHGGNAEQMKILNNEYDYLKNKLSNDETIDKDYLKETVFSMDYFKDIITELLKYNHITIEIVGSWLWISGIGTYAIKDEILYNKFNCKFSKSQKKFYWYSGIDKDSRKKYKGGFLSQAIDKYGITTLESEPKPVLV
jgi:curved DNA-binding protein CbpA